MGWILRRIWEGRRRRSGMSYRLLCNNNRIMEMACSFFALAGCLSLGLAKEHLML